MPSRDRIKSFYQLTKPGIIRGNLVTAAAGFFLASQGDIDWLTGIALLAGLGLVIASACVTNNYLDRELDRKMERTSQRALVSGSISSHAALAFAALLGVGGSAVLLVATTALAFITATIGWIAYVAVYGYYKRRSTLGTAVGSISGAIPPVVGYVAVTGRLDGAALILFLTLTFWQMPHFFAIAVYRLKDYAAAELPVLPVAKGFTKTRLQTLMYIVGYAAASVSLTVFGYTGMMYALLMLGISGWWFTVAFRQPAAAADRPKWGRRVFLVSLVAITVQCILIAFDSSFLKA